MIKVLIADDEKYIRNGIHDAFDWAALGMEVAGLAANGSEALEIARKTLPDICLLDICMPIVSGLEFVEQANAFLDGPVFIVITGYDDFRYAKQALALGVYDYILKPIDEDALRILLKKACAEVEERRQKRADYAEARSLVDQNKPVLEAELLRRLVAEEGDNTQIRESLALLGVEISANMGYVRFFDLKKADIETMEEKQQREAETKKLRTAAEAALERFRPFATLINKDDSISALYTPREEEEQLVIKGNVTAGMARDIHAYFSRVEGYDVHAAHLLVKTRIAQDTQTLPIVNRIMEYVRENYADPALQLNAFAEKNSVSAGYLTKLFRQETGDTFVAYMTKYRMKQAALLLGGTDLKIYEIAEKAGYNSQHYFCEIFKNMFGVTPTEYRKKGAVRDEE
jgi:two-component system response regulator YesN